jgi:hypothetical protein
LFYQHFLGKEQVDALEPAPAPSDVPVAVGDRRFDVLVRIQYAAALNRRLSLGVVPYSEWVGRSHRYRTRLTVRADHLASLICPIPVKADRGRERPRRITAVSRIPGTGRL